ncbi:MAG: flagellar basal body rod protein FlgC [Planctomycetota bacterium]
MFGALNVSTSALVAERVRAEAYAANVANSNAIVDKNGENNPFQRRVPIMAPGDPSSGSGQGVHVREILIDQSAPKLRYMPGHPLAAKEGPNAGYVKFPNINSSIEQMNMLTASRAYEANITAAEATKSMMRSSLRLLG